MTNIKERFVEIINNYDFDNGSLNSLAKQYCVSSRYLKNIIKEYEIPYKGHKNKSNKPKNNKGQFCCNRQTLELLNIVNEKSKENEKPKSSKVDINLFKKSNSNDYVLDEIVINKIDKIINNLNSNIDKLPNETYKEHHNKLKQNQEKIKYLNSIIAQNESTNVEDRKRSKENLKKFLKENNYLKN